MSGGFAVGRCAFGRSFLSSRCRFAVHGNVQVRGNLGRIARSTYLFLSDAQYIDVSKTPVDDAGLLAGARRGEETAFLALYQRYRTPLFRFAWRFTGSAHAAEDVTQECFLAIFAGAAFDPKQGSLRTYLFGIARHLAMKRLRIEERESAEPDAAADAAAPCDTLGDLIGQERSAAVERAVAALPPLQKEALILSEYEDLSLEEIAQVAGVEVGAVKARLHRARETLRRRLAPLLDPRAGPMNAPCPARRNL
jgi:RNA polymerase sigma-70 factor (ECF subfamily)